MTTRQMDEVGSRHFQLPPKAPEYFEVVKRTVAYSDQRDGTSYNEQIISVHTSREAAMESIIPKDYIVRPLTVKS